MAINLRAVLQSEYDLQVEDCFPNGIRYENETPQHKFVSVVGPLSNGSPFILLTARDSFDKMLCKSLFLFLDSHSACLSLERGVTIIEKFQHDDYAFDSVLVLNGSYHRSYEHFSNELNQHTLEAFPILRCEFTGSETVDEMEGIRRYGPCTIDWHREPSPYVKMRFHNQKTGASSFGKQLWYTKARNAEDELLELTDEPKSFVEIMNFLGEWVRIVVTAETYTIKGNDSSRSVHKSHITSWLKEFLMMGMESL